MPLGEFLCKMQIRCILHFIPYRFLLICFDRFLFQCFITKKFSFFDIPDAWWYDLQIPIRGMLTIILNNQDKLHGFVNIISAMVESELKRIWYSSEQARFFKISAANSKCSCIITKVIYGRLSGGDIYIFSSMQTLYALASTLINAFGS